MGQWNKLLKCLGEMDFTAFTPIALGSEEKGETPCNAYVLLSPQDLAGEGPMETWHIFPAVYDEAEQSFRVPGDSCCRRCTPVTRLLEGATVPGSLYLEDARIFFAVLQNQGTSICGDCLGTLYSPSRDSSVESASEELAIKNLML